MQVLRKVALAVCTTVFGLGLIGLAWSHSMTSTLRDQNRIKSWLAESGLYDEISESITDQVTRDAPTEALAMADNSEAQQIVRSTLGSSVAKNSAEELLDGIYAWLEGGELPAQLNIDLSKQSEQLSAGLREYATERAAKLPICTPAQTVALRASYDVWSSPCRPQQLSATKIGEQANQQVLASTKDYQTEISTKEILGTDGKELPEQIRQAYQLSSWLPFAFLMLAVASGAGVILFSSTRLKGLGSAGWTTVLSGVTIGFSAFILSKGPGFVRTQMEGNELSTINIMARLTEVAGQDIARMLWWYGAGFIAIGLLATVVAKANRQPSSPTSNKPSLGTNSTYRQ